MPSTQETIVEQQTNAAQEMTGGLVLGFAMNTSQPQSNEEQGYNAEQMQLIKQDNSALIKLNGQLKTEIEKFKLRNIELASELASIRDKEREERSKKKYI